jgi:hypothetical protein
MASTKMNRSMEDIITPALTDHFLDTTDTLVPRPKFGTVWTPQC